MCIIRHNEAIYLQSMLKGGAGGAEKHNSEKIDMQKVMQISAFQSGIETDWSSNDPELLRLNRKSGSQALGSIEFGCG